MAKYNYGGLAISPYSFQHEYVPGARFLAVNNARGMHVLFRIKEGFSTPVAIANAKTRGFTPLYVIRTRAKS